MGTMVGGARGGRSERGRERWGDFCAAALKAYARRDVVVTALRIKTVLAGE